MKLTKQQQAVVDIVLDYGAGAVSDAELDAVVHRAKAKGVDMDKVRRALARHQQERRRRAIAAKRRGVTK